VSFGCRIRGGEHAILGHARCCIILSFGDMLG